MPKCAQCGCEVEKYTYETLKLCQECTWDHSFESSSDNAYKIAFMNLADKLGKQCTDETRNAIKELITEWGPLEWKCPSCGEVIISKELSKQLSIEDKVTRLCTPCTCGTYPVPTHPEKYY